MVRPVQQQFVMNAVNTSVPVIAPPNFPSIQQALLGAARAADQPVSTVTTSAIAAVTASVVPDPAVIKTLLASKLARNITQQQQHCEVATSSASVSSVPSSSSASPSPLSAVTCAADVVGAAKDNCVTVSSAAGHVAPPAGEIVNTVSEKAELAVESNGLTVAVSSMSASLVSSCSFASTATASSCLANGHAKQFHDPSALMNGICSPVPSCSSEDQEPLRDVKVPKSPGYGNSCDGVVVNGDVMDNEADDDDDDDDGSELDDCDGDMLVKAMMHADIIDCGGRPAVTDNSCDEDSHMSTDFLSGYVESAGDDEGSRDVGTGDQVSSTDTGVGCFDSETAAAVADLLHETGMMADDEAAVSEMSASANDNGLSYDNDVTVAAADNECVVAASSEALSLATDGVSAAVDDCSATAAVFDEQLGCHSTAADVTQQTVHDKEAEAQVDASSLVGLSSTSTVIDGLAAPSLACSANTTGAGIPPVSCSTAPTQPPVSSVSAATQLQNGVMVVPPHGISLPSGQFISGGTRLLIRPIASVQQAVSSTAMRLTQPSLAPTVLSAQPASSVTSTSSSSVVDGNVQSSASSVPVSTSAPAPAVRFVSTTTSQGQLIIQRAQILTSTSSPLIQRVIVPQVPRPIAVRSEGQVILQATQPSQQIGGRPVLLTQTPFAAGQLHVAAPGMQLVPGSSTHSQSIVLQSGHVISVQPQPLSTHDVPQSSGQVQIATASNLPLLAAKPNPDQLQNQSVTGDGTQPSSSQPVIQAAGPQLSTSVKPSLRPLMSTSQQPMQIVGGPVQLRAGLVSLPTGSGNASVILQHGGRPILLQSPNVGSTQHPSSYVVFRPGPLPVPSSSQELTNNVAVSSAALTSASSSSVGPDALSRKRPLPALPSTVTRSMRKKTKKDEDYGLSFVCEWSGCQRWIFLLLFPVNISQF